MNVRTGMSKSQWSGAERKDIENVIFEYNTIVNCEVGGFQSSNNYDTILRRNLFYECNRASVDLIFYGMWGWGGGVPDPNPAELVTNENCIYHTVAQDLFLWLGYGNILSHPEARDTYGYDVDSVMWQDPQFLSTTYGDPDFLRPAAGSPCEGMGYYANLQQCNVDASACSISLGTISNCSQQNLIYQYDSTETVENVVSGLEADVQHDIKIENLTLGSEQNINRNSNSAGVLVFSS